MELCWVCASLDPTYAYYGYAPHTRSSTAAMPWPTPMHMETSA
jgi:hypothetical protein